MRVAGIGFRSNATCASLHSALARAVGEGAPVQAIATETGKSETRVFRDFAAALSLPVYAIARHTLAQMITPTHSARVSAQFGTGSLAEAAALAAAGPDATLVAARVVSGDNMATAAIADTRGIET